MDSNQERCDFLNCLRGFCGTLTDYVSINGGDWSIKGFIDNAQNIYSISSDTKIISKILEIQLFPKFFEFAERKGYDLVLAEHQNWYPDMSFVKKTDQSVKFAVDIKTTYRHPDKKDFCNGFTLGSHGGYFKNRTSTKNIQYPYAEYKAHICLGIIYTRISEENRGETEVKALKDLTTIQSVITDMLFFAEEKWKIASDQSGSGNTANIGSIRCISDILSGHGTFARLGESVFDDYWMNKGEMKVPHPENPNEYKKLSKLEEFLDFRGMDKSLVNKPKSRRKVRKP